MRSRVCECEMLDEREFRVSKWVSYKMIEFAMAKTKPFYGMLSNAHIGKWCIHTTNTIPIAPFTNMV